MKFHRNADTPRAFVQALPGARGRRDGRQGAALIIAISIMTILLAIALTFFAVTRVEIKTATNVVNAVRVELLGDAAIAMAVAQLNQDLLDHPAATSTDHGWRSLYSGTAFAGKPWTWRDLPAPTPTDPDNRAPRPLWAGGIPQIDMRRMPYIDLEGDGIPDERLYLGPETRNWLAIPRVEQVNRYNSPTPVLYAPDAELYDADDPDGDPLRLDAADAFGDFRFVRYDDTLDIPVGDNFPPEFFPFATSKFYGTPRFPNGAAVFGDLLAQRQEEDDKDNLQYSAEQVDFWADVDNTGDGLKDSMWIPIPIDLFFPDDGIDNDLDGMTDEEQDDGIDNDRDGILDEVDSDGDGQPDEQFDEDEAIEAAPFIYYGGNDNIDNDGDGFVDQDDNPANEDAEPPYEWAGWEIPDDPDSDPIYDPLNLEDSVLLDSPPATAPNNLGFFLTCPLPGIRIKVDLDANGVIGNDGDLVTVTDNTGEPKRVPAEITLPDTIEFVVAIPSQQPGQEPTPVTVVQLDNTHVDAVDNDYDMFANEYSTYAYIGPPATVADPRFLYSSSDASWQPVGNWLFRDDNLNGEQDAGEPTIESLYSAAASNAYHDIHLERLGAGMDNDTLNDDWKALYANPLDFMNGEPVNPDLADLSYRLRVTHTGEPVCDLVGRAAIHISDEQGKVNPNAAGGHTYRDQVGEYATVPQNGIVHRAMDQGATPHEYETRVLPDIGLTRSANLWGYLTGSPQGLNLPVTEEGGNLLDPPQEEESFDDIVLRLGDYFTDVAFPGYGRVDDNMNSLVIGLNGINDDGDFDIDLVSGETPFRQLVDEGLYVPPLSSLAEDVLLGIADFSNADNFNRDYGAGNFGLADEELDVYRAVDTELRGNFAPYFLRLGAFEGVDEPGELQLSRPLRNRIAERDSVPGGEGALNNDPPSVNNVANEYGELADQVFRTNEDVETVYFGKEKFARSVRSRLKRLISPYATDRNVRTITGPGGIRTLPRLDLNRATAQELTAGLILTARLRPSLDLTAPDPEFPALDQPYLLQSDADAPPIPARQFFQGLRQADVAVRAPESIRHNGPAGFLYDVYVDYNEDTGVGLPQYEPYDGLNEAGGPSDVFPSSNPALGHRMPEDPILSAMLTAVDIADARDRDHARTVLTTEPHDLINRPEEHAAAAAGDPEEDVFQWGSLFNDYPFDDPGPREEIPEKELMHLEDVQQYAENQLEDDTFPNLEIKDTWWADRVEQVADVGGDIVVKPQERRITYTAAGNEAVKINEIMVRAVRRVEAEATPDAVNFPGTQPVNAYSVDRDPTPFYNVTMGIDEDGEPTFVADLPEFPIRTQTLATVFDRLDDRDLGVGDWGLYDAAGGPGVLGENTLVSTTRQWTRGIDPEDIDNPDRNSRIEEHQQSLPNAIEYLFVAGPGLPQGRYYLTMNIAAGAGQMSVTEGGKIKYAIKYVPIDDDAFETNGAIQPYADTDTGEQATTILEDMYFLAQLIGNRPFEPLPGMNLWLQPDRPQGDFIANAFQEVREEHMAIDGSNRKRRGWVFLDGNPHEQPIDAMLDPVDGFITALLNVNPDFINPASYFEPGLAVTENPGRTAGGSLRTGLGALSPYAPLEVPDGSGDTEIPGTHTVLVPPPGFALNVAIMLDPEADIEDGDSLEINFFDFSQEPDHEWVELVNTSDDPVDISGWALETGIPQVSGVTIDDQLSQAPRALTIPDGTVMAPGGMVLLTVDKFDLFQRIDADPNAPLVSRNGIGAAQGAIGTGDVFAEPYAFVTAPPIPYADVRYNYQYNPGEEEADEAVDPTGSVFQRYSPNLDDFRAGSDPAPSEEDPESVNYADFVDRDGDGVGDAAVSSDATYRSTPDIPGVLQGPNKPWDRIVPLIWENPPEDLEDIVEIVLQGGIFPNYPEFDGVDNDGDGGYETRDGFMRGVLASDMVDNDLDGFIDEPDEGIDEGRKLLNGQFFYAGDYSGVNLPFVFHNRGGVLYDLHLVAGGDQGIEADAESLFFTGVGGDQYVERYEWPIDGATHPNTVPAPYIGSELDPPEWKAFVQRRWFPGDNVIVSLYDAPPDQGGRVVDRVTYNQVDVENRSIDDVVPSPYSVNLNPDYPTAWSPNHMGLDFYRSLERKHPMYHGDRFGTRNRWQATDGNYDDWAESITPWEREQDHDNWPPPFYDGPDLGQNYAYFRFDPDLEPLSEDQLDARKLLFGHAYSGTPLRRNLATTLLEGALLDGAPLEGAPQREEFPLYVGPDSGDFIDLDNPSFGLRMAGIRNHQFASPGELLGLPRVRFDHLMLNTRQTVGSTDLTYLNPMVRVNQTVSGGPGGDTFPHYDPINLRSGLLGQADRGRIAGNDTPLVRHQIDTELPAEDLLTSAIDTVSTDSIVLTVGQATYRPIRPNRGEAAALGVDIADLYAWSGDDAGAPNPRAPAAWTPVFMFAFPDEPDMRETGIRYTNLPIVDFQDGDVVSADSSVVLPRWPTLFNPYQLYWQQGNWLIHSVFPGYRPQQDASSLDRFAGRWPVEKRVVAYVAQNVPDGAPGTPAATRHRVQRAEGLFEWDADDGLENGVYTLYVGTFIPGLRQALARGDNMATSAQLPAAVTADGPDNPPWAGQNLLQPTNTGDGAVTIGRHLPDADALAGNEMNMALEMEVHTSRTRTSGVLRGDRAVAPGVTDEEFPIEALEPPDTNFPGDPTVGNPADLWEGVVRQPGTNGYVLYGEPGYSNWRPIRVEVTDNYLALRVRNVSPAAVPNMITHVVLAPRGRTRGRVNVNTSETMLAGNENTPQLFNVLMGLPGIINGDLENTDNNFNTYYRDNLDMPSVAPELDYAPGAPWPTPEEFSGRAVPPLRNVAPIDGESDPRAVLRDVGEMRSASLQLTGLLKEGMPEHMDGRYYTSPAQLTLNSSMFANERDPGLDDRFKQVYPLSNADNPDARFNDIYQRFRRMANMVTTRSDLFRIKATVQSGYGIDLNNDGFINYRDDDEFVATAESRVTSVYERRTPRPTPQPLRTD